MTASRRLISLSLAGLLAAGALTPRATPQNLVPNGSFETVDPCPSGKAQIHRAPPWIAASVSPDLYHLCGSGPVTTPVNTFGVQTPFSGQGYAGTAAYFTSVDMPTLDGLREYPAAPLLAPLIAGRTYLVSFMVSLAEVSDTAIDTLGAHLSVGQVLGTGLTHLPVVPQVESPPGTFLDDRTGWTRISGMYTAVGGEDWITLGNFRDNASTGVSDPGDERAAYYYIDEVEVRAVECSTPPGMLGWWSFDEDGSATSSGEMVQGLDANHIASPQAVAGADGNALRMAPGGFAAVISPPALGTDDFTLDFWVEPDVVGLPHAVLYKGGVGSLERVAVYVTATGELSLSVADAADLAVYETVGAGLTAPGVWRHVTITVDRGGEVVRFYVDAQPVTSSLAASTGGGMPAGSFDSPSAMTLGIDTGPTQLRGALDELEIFGRILTPAEIELLVVAGKCKTQAGLATVLGTSPAEGQVAGAAWVCNDGVVDATYELTLLSAPAAGPASAPGPDTFTWAATPGPTRTVVVPAGQSLVVPYDVLHAGLAPGLLSRYRLLAVDVDSARVFEGEAFVRGVPSGPLRVRPGGPLTATAGTPVTAGFEIEAPGAGAVLTYSIRVVETPVVPGGFPGPPPAGEILTAPVGPGGGGSSVGARGTVVSGGTAPEPSPLGEPDSLQAHLVEEQQVVSLEGLAPGTPVSGVLPVGAGATVSLDVDVEFLEHVPFEIFQLVLEADLDGDGGQEVVAAVPLRSEAP